jgi:hypothetical protein
LYKATSSPDHDRLSPRFDGKAEISFAASPQGSQKLQSYPPKAVETPQPPGNCSENLLPCISSVLASGGTENSRNFLFAGWVINYVGINHQQAAFPPAPTRQTTGKTGRHIPVGEQANEHYGSRIETSGGWYGKRCCGNTV